MTDAEYAAACDVDLSDDEITGYEPPFICPNCGAAGGSPVYIRSQESAATGYVDEFDGCSRCCEDDIERARRLRG